MKPSVQIAEKQKGMRKMNNPIRSALLVQFYGHLVEAKKTGLDTHYDHLADDVVEEIIQELRLQYKPGAEVN